MSCLVTLIYASATGAREKLSDFDMLLAKNKSKNVPTTGIEPVANRCLLLNFYSLSLYHLS